MVKEVQYDCWTCWDGELVDVGEKCPDCGCRGKRGKDLHSWERGVRGRLSSADFEDRVRLARHALGIPPEGYTPKQTRDHLFGVYLALGISYCWSLTTFQDKLLPLKEEAERLPLFRHLGASAEFATKLTYPFSGRADGVEWLLLAKLISARLASWLETDNASDIFLYLLCPQLQPPDSWGLKRPSHGSDLALLQFQRFMSALLPIPERFMTKRGLRDLFLASAKAARDASPTSLEDERAVFTAMFPEWGAEYPKKHQVRIRRADRRLQQEQWLKLLSTIIRQLSR